MNLKEYLIKLSTSLDTEEGFYHIMIDEHNFRLHKDCWIDFHEDFMILYDKQTKVNLLVRYDSISAIQHVPEDKVKELKSRGSALAQLFKEALEDDDCTIQHMEDQKWQLKKKLKKTPLKKWHH